MKQAYAMDSFLAVITRSKRKFEGKLSLSCGDLAALNSQYEEGGTIEKRKYTKDASFDSSWPRFLRRKSAGLAAGSNTGSMDRTKSKSSSELANDFDCQLAEIKEKLARFREQDAEFHERMDSLNHSIGELASRTSLNSSTPSAASNLFIDEDDSDSDVEQEQNYFDAGDENEIGTISNSFLSEVLNSIPAIKVTCDKKSLLRRRRSSDPTVHEAARSSIAAVRPRSICSPDYGYLYEEEVSTLL